MQKILSLAVTAVMLSGCSTPIRSDVEDFPSKLVRQVSPTDIPAFSDCVQDGFLELEKMWPSPRQVRQERRALGLRIDTRGAANTVLFVSVDILNSGHVELYETGHLPLRLISKQPERDVFAACLKKHQQL